MNQSQIYEFLNWDSWFSEFKSKPGGRFWTFKSAIGLFLQIPNSKIIVETGCLRQNEDWGAGMSTYIFGRICKEYDKYLFTVDNDPEHLDMAKVVTKEFAEYINYNLDNSINFLQKFTRPIDLLYLDSLDCPLEEDADASIAQKHQLKELLSVYKLLTDHSVVLLDDNNWKNGGKTLLTKRFLFENNWKCVLDDRQSLWLKQ